MNRKEFRKKVLQELEWQRLYMLLKDSPNTKGGDNLPPPFPPPNNDPED